MKTIFALLAAATALSGCVAAYDYRDGHPNRYRDYHYNYYYDHDYDRDYDRRESCPPGHRMKHWC